MTLRKIAVDNSVKYVPKSEQTKERDSKPKTTKASSLPRKQNKKPSQSNKKFPNNISASGFSNLKRSMNCYFKYKKHTDTLIEQTKTKAQEMLEFKMIR